MGLFGKLFEKKECAICSGEIGMLGNRKLEDGNMCKNCAAKLSPWFSDRKRSTVEDIQGQLAYREENKQVVEAFRITRTFGENYLLCLDEDQKKFLVSRSGKNLKGENPDVLDFSQVTGCELDVDEHRHEEKRTGPDGKQVSYNPPHYHYTYDFNIVIRVRHPYFDVIRFKLNAHSVEGSQQVTRGGVFGTTMTSGSTGGEYRQYEEMGREIKEALLSARQQMRDEVDAATAPKTAMTCPWCGATTTPDASGCCEYCGGALKN